MISIGILGAGHLGKIHLNLLRQLSEFDIKGFYDQDPATAQAAEQLTGIKSVASAEELLDNCEAIDIVTPTAAHFPYAAAAIKAGKHVFIEKPVTLNADEARKLQVLVREANVVAHVGHVERFNPAFMAARKHISRPLYIECQRHAVFNPRGTDVSVVLDLMVHDIDLILNMVNSNIKRIHASGLSLMCPSEDVAEARIEFDNGCVATISENRAAIQNIRKMTVFQMEDFFTIDLLEKTASRAYPCDPHPGAMFLRTDKLETQPINAIQHELALFAKAIKKEKTAGVSLDEAAATMKVADQVLEAIRNQK